MTFTEPSNLTGLYEIFNYTNNVTDGIFGILICITLYLVIFLYLKFEYHHTADCMMAAGFLTTIVAIFLRLINLISSKDLFWFILLTVLSALYGLWSKDT